MTDSIPDASSSPAARGRRDDRPFDVVLWGATGFTGSLTAEHLLRTHGAAGELRWALGGRDAAKLDALRHVLSSETGVDASRVPLEVGDVRDRVFLAELARKTRVVCTTVGPYSRFGTPLVESCVDAGSDYCDLSGEVHWMRQMIDRFHEPAERSGARIVHACGFDSVPFDVGVFFVQREMRARHGAPAPHVGLGIASMNGAASGGTIASLLAILEDAERDRSVFEIVRDPYALNPASERSGPDAPEASTPRFDSRFGQWTAPFFMSAINTKIVRRTNALTRWSYGRDFRYDEALLTGRGAAGALKATAAATGSAAGLAAMSIGRIRSAVSSRLPQPGEGPSRAQRERGSFELLLVAEHPSEPRRSLRARVHGDQDPGYGCTSKMLGESAVCLARDPLDAHGGVWTPAAAMGAPLLERLSRSAGLTFEILEDEASE